MKALKAETELGLSRSQTPAKESDGWIPHKPGDPMPCDPVTFVALRFRSGTTSQPEDLGPAGDFDWDVYEDEEYDSDIVAWKPAT
jgi:hypothetical protein